MSDDMATTIERDTAQRSARPSPVSPDEPAAPAKPGGRKRTVFIIMGVALLGLVAVGARRWIYSLSHVSTDNAQVRSEERRVGKEGRSRWSPEHNENTTRSARDA